MQNIKLTNKQLETLKSKHQLRDANGSEGQIYLYNDNGQKVAIKLFNTTNLNILENKEKKIILLNKLPLNENILKPIKTVSNNEQVIGYTQELIWPHHTFSELKILMLKKDKIDVLKQAKSLIENLHNNGIVHGDIRSLNLLSQDKKVKICDIDNCIIDGLNFDTYGWFTNDYNKNVKCIDERLDIFCFNLVTLALLKRIMDDTVYAHMKDAYIFNKDIKKIYEEMLNLTENYNGEYLIDYINQKTKIKLL